MDEFDDYRDKQNCPICSGVWSEDDMTAIQYANLSELEKDDYDEQLLKLIKNSPVFDESMHHNCSTNDGQWWGGFRVDKYIKLETEERIIKSLLERRKANEPFKPFPPIDTVKAREVAEDAEITHKALERGYYVQTHNQKGNVPRCPICNSRDIKRITLSKRAVKTVAFGIIGTIDDAGKSCQCNNCKSKF